ncbi:MAG: type II toxin-antitoxin system RelE/ParE family toxin [Bacteroidaceae bacterium]|nr:type II toxin-antitoxin system RelE/ParE family toxin [Bacteroidaceae bacterium]
MKIEWTEDALQSYEMVLGYTAQNFGIQQVHKIRSIIEAKVASLLSFSSFGVHEYEWSYERMRCLGLAVGVLGLNA